MHVLPILAMRRRLILVLEVDATLGTGADRALPAENTLRARRLRRLSARGLVRHRVRHRVNVEVLRYGLLYIRNINLTISTHLREHALLKSSVDDVAHFLVNVELEQYIRDLVYLADRDERCDGFESQVTNLLLVVIQ